ncbi:MAG: ATP-binding protein, partial [Prevotellaceae bacterium]|nr:ATP-binding protein [Prevotellaceae bacterium]
LFKGLYIHDKWDWNQKYPVIRLDWSRINHETIEEIDEDLTDVLKLKAKSFGITLFRKKASGCLDELIDELYNKTGKKVVILIDEYDVPILDAMDKSNEELKAIQKELHNIYKVLKGADEHVKFIFLTGVSKFAGLSIFSALNNPNDITLSKKYATICGITQEEMENNFSEYLDVAAEELSETREELLSDIRKWYNGYSWDGKTSVYNPVSIMQFFDKIDFRCYWFATGTPTFLITLLKKRNNIETFLQPVQAREAVFSSYDPARLATLPLLFQTGYLTITKITRDDDHSLTYTFEPPNYEVREAFIEHLAQAYSELEPDEMTELRKNMHQQLKAGDSEGLEKSLRAMIAHVPYQLHIESEKYYHSLLLAWFYFLGFKPLGELSTNIGRIDAVWKVPGMNIVTEIKYSLDQPLDKLLDKASKQTHDRKYYEAFFDEPAKIVLVSIAFSGREPGCRIETLDN